MIYTEMIFKNTKEVDKKIPDTNKVINTNQLNNIPKFIFEAKLLEASKKIAVKVKQRLYLIQEIKTFQEKKNYKTYVIDDES